MIWLMPVIGLMMYIAMGILNRYPHIFNYPQKITAENTERQYRRARKLIRILKTTFVCFFAYITFVIINNAMGHHTGLGSFSIPLLLLLVFGSIGYFMYTSIRDK